MRQHLMINGKTIMKMGNDFPDVSKDYPLLQDQKGIPTLLTTSPGQPLSIGEAINFKFVQTPTASRLLQRAETPSGVARAQRVVREDVRQLSQHFADRSRRLAAGVRLQQSLITLQREARKCSYRLLCRVAAVLSHTLKHNPIEDFTEAEWQAFVEASRQATEVTPQRADPRACERRLRAAGLSWLPPMLPIPDETDESDEED